MYISKSLTQYHISLSSLTAQSKKPSPTVTLAVDASKTCVNSSLISNTYVNFKSSGRFKLSDGNKSCQSAHKLDCL